MDAARLGTEVHVRLQERAVRFVGLARLDDHLGQRVLMVVQKLLGKAGRALRGLGVLNAQAVKGVGDGRRAPDVDLDACLLFHLFEQLVLAGAHAVNHQAAPVSVKPDASAGHLQQHREHIGLDVEDGFDFVLTHLDLEVLPKLQGQRRVLLGVLANVHRRELPELLFRMDTEIGCGLLEALLTLDLLEVVETKRIEAEAEAIFVKQWGGKHCVQDSAIDCESTGTQPPGVVGCVVHDFVGGGGKDVFDPRLHSSLIQIATASMSNRIVARPTVHSDGVSNNKTVTTRPARAEGLQVRITCFKVNCNLLSCG
jgi:hypothetical protein